MASRAELRIRVNQAPQSRPAETPRLELQRRLSRPEEELREAQRQLSSLLTTLYGVFYRCEAATPWKKSFTGEKVQELTGHPPETFESRLSWAEIMHADDVGPVERAVTESLASKSPFAVDYRIVHSSGEERWMRECGRPVLNDEGDVIFLEGIISDCTEQKQLQLSLAERLRAQEVGPRHWHDILDVMPHMVWTVEQGNEGYYNRQWLEFTGHRGSHFNRMRFLHPDDRKQARSAWAAAKKNGTPYQCEYRLRHHSGEYRWVLSRGYPDKDDKGNVIGWCGTCTDIHERVLAQQALHESVSLSRSMIEASPDCIKLLDHDGIVLFINDAGCRVIELEDTSTLIGRHWLKTLPRNARSAAATALEEAKRGGFGHLTLYQPTMTGIPKWWDIVTAPIPDEDGKPARLLIISRDITHQKRAEEQVAWTANHDGLTNLANRTLFQNRVERALEECHALGGQFAILLLDLDHFKRVNDTLGHDAGDKLLCAFAERLTAAARADDVVARLGGDEFAILLSGISCQKEVAAAVEGLLDRLREPCVHAGRMLDCHASIGASIYPAHGSDRATLLKNADIALYAAKAAGRGSFKLFEPHLRREMQLRSSMLNLAEDSLRKGRILPFYQPKVELRTGRTAGFEALLRWKHPTRGIQLPATIDAAFDDMNLAAEISDYMVDCVVDDMRRWLDDGVDFGHVAVNAAAAEFRRGDFAEKLLERLARAQIPSRNLQLEVTETVFLGRGAECVERALKLLSKEGVQIALDDFGTGYASLSHLKQFPVDLIKIDRSFVGDFDRFPHDAAIIKAVISLGKGLGIKVIAEGIETESHHRFLLGAGCEFGQGFLYATAVPADEVPLLIGERRNIVMAA